MYSPSLEFPNCSGKETNVCLVHFAPWVETVSMDYYFMWVFCIFCICIFVLFMFVFSPVCICFVFVFRTFLCLRLYLVHIVFVLYLVHFAPWVETVSMDYYFMWVFCILCFCIFGLSVFPKYLYFLCNSGILPQFCLKTN